MSFLAIIYSEIGIGAYIGSTSSKWLRCLSFLPQVLEALIAAGGNYAAPTVLLIVLFALFWAQRRPRRTYKHPPGPKGIPLLGYLPFLGTNHHQLFLDLSKIYGPVVRCV